jgi:hypothetical protein
MYPSLVVVIRLGGLICTCNTDCGNEASSSSKPSKLSKYLLRIWKLSALLSGKYP